MTTTATADDARTANWHGLSAEEVCAQVGAEPGTGLDGAEVEKRRAQYGPNKLAEAEKEPGWHAHPRSDLAVRPRATRDAGPDRQLARSHS